MYDLTFVGLTLLFFGVTAWAIYALGKI